MNMYIHIHLYMCIYIYTLSLSLSLSHTHTHTRAHTHTHTHTHTPVLASGGEAAATDHREMFSVIALRRCYIFPPISWQQNPVPLRIRDASTPTRLYPHTEAFRLQIVTIAKISNKFSQESPYISKTFCRESQKFQTGFHVSKRSPCHSKYFVVKPYNLEMQIF